MDGITNYKSFIAWLVTLSKMPKSQKERTDETKMFYKSVKNFAVTAAVLRLSQEELMKLESDLESKRVNVVTSRDKRGNEETERVLVFGRNDCSLSENTKKNLVDYYGTPRFECNLRFLMSIMFDKDPSHDRCLIG